MGVEIGLDKRIIYCIQFDTGHKYFGVTDCDWFDKQLYDMLRKYEHPCFRVNDLASRRHFTIVTVAKVHSKYAYATLDAILRQELASCTLLNDLSDLMGHAPVKSVKVANEPKIPVNRYVKKADKQKQHVDKPDKSDKSDKSDKPNKPKKSKCRYKNVVIDNVVYASVAQASKCQRVAVQTVINRCKSDKWPTWSTQICGE